MTTLLLAHLMTGCSAFAALGLAVAGTNTDALPRPVRGHRGSMRARALARSALFRAVEPMLRQLAGWLVALRFPPPRLSRELERHLVWSGQHLGLDARELASLSLLSVLLTAPMAVVICRWSQANPTWSLVATLAAGALPLLAVRDRVRARTREIERRLPAALDLAVLCVGAGMDLGAALELIARHGTHDALTLELKRVLAELAMGRTREQALDGFAHRVRSDAVRDFTTAVTQAELKGTPLADALVIQAKVARNRRSVAAEEAAAHASVMLALPLLLLLCCVLLLLFGPLIVTGSVLQ